MRRLVGVFGERVSESVKPDVQLLEGEKLKLRLNPHILSFYNLYAIWVFVIALSGVFLYLNEYLADFIEHRTGFMGLLAPFTGQTPELLQGFAPLNTVTGIVGMFLGPFIYGENLAGLVLLGIWFSIVMLAGTTVSIIRISWRWIPILVGVLLVSAGLTIVFKLPYAYAYVFGTILSSIGLVGVEFFRRGHVFYVTNYRVITELKFFTEKENALSYDKINNVVLERPLLGVLFNFGTVIPITASGLGMGEDSAAVTVGAMAGAGRGRHVGVGVTGGQTVGVPRSRSAYALYGVPNPKHVYEVINKHMHEFVEAPYLKEMVGELKGMREDRHDDDSGGGERKRKESGVEKKRGDSSGDKKRKDSGVDRHQY